MRDFILSGYGVLPFAERDKVKRELSLKELVKNKTIASTEFINYAFNIIIFSRR